MAEERDIKQFFATGNAATPPDIEPLPKLADEFQEGVPFKQAIENWDKKMADWLKRTQVGLK